MIKVVAGNRFTLAAGVDLVFSEFWAAPYYVAVFGSWKATFTVGYFAPLPWDAMRMSQVSLAQCTVHSAWRNKVRGEFV